MKKLPDRVFLVYDEGDPDVPFLFANERALAEDENVILSGNDDDLVGEYVLVSTGHVSRKYVADKETPNKKS